MIDIVKAQRDGLVVQTAQGQDALKITAQCPTQFSTETKPARTAALTQWAQNLERQLPSGCEVDFNSLATLGQTVTLTVPLAEITSTETLMKKQGIRLDLIRAAKLA